jgi:methylated-DNA-[protein]-cysteine S-methyltransferase
MTQMTVQTPFGEFSMLDQNNHLIVACPTDHCITYEPLFDEASEIASPVLLQAERELKEYLEGKRVHFETPLGLYADDWNMGTPFEKRAWETLMKIGFGRTITYKEQALWMGNPKAIRAVARANGKNPLSIFVPCHRVIGTNGSLTGYSGGLDMKAWLLKHEASIVDSPLVKSIEHHFAVLK